MRPADVTQIAVANHQVVRIAAAETVGCAVHQGQSIVDHVMLAALVDDVPSQGQFDAPVSRGRGGLDVEIDPLR